MTNTIYTGFLCEFSSTQIIICGAVAVTALSRTDDEEREKSETYRCARHTPTIEHTDQAGYDIDVLPVTIVREVAVA